MTKRSETSAKTNDKENMHRKYLYKHSTLIQNITNYALQLEIYKARYI